MMVILYFIAIFTSLVTHSYSSALENHRNVEEIEINCEKFIDENGEHFGRQDGGNEECDGNIGVKGSCENYRQCIAIPQAGRRLSSAPGACRIGEHFVFPERKCAIKHPADCPQRKCFPEDRQSKQEPIYTPPEDDNLIPRSSITNTSVTVTSTQPVRSHGVCGKSSVFLPEIITLITYLFIYK